MCYTKPIPPLQEIQLLISQFQLAFRTTALPQSQGYVIVLFPRLGPFFFFIKANISICRHFLCFVEWSAAGLADSYWKVHSLGKFHARLAKFYLESCPPSLYVRWDKGPPQLQSKLHPSHLMRNTTFILFSNSIFSDFRYQISRMPKVPKRTEFRISFGHFRHNLQVHDWQVSLYIWIFQDQKYKVNGESPNMWVHGQVYKPKFLSRVLIETSYLIFVIFFTLALFEGLKILHLKARKFATKIALRQNSVNQYFV